MQELAGSHLTARQSRDRINSMHSMTLKLCSKGGVHLEIEEYAGPVWVASRQQAGKDTRQRKMTPVAFGSNPRWARPERSEIRLLKVAQSRMSQERK